MPARPARTCCCCGHSCCGRKAFWTSYGILGCCQLAFNAALTGPGIVRYDRSAILGLRLAYAPIEDLGFGFALILLTLACWVAAGRTTAHRRP